MVKLKSPLMRGTKGKLAGTTIYTSNDLTSLMDAALKSKQGNVIYTESAQYLNNAGTGGTQGSGSEAGGSTDSMQISNTVQFKTTPSGNWISQDMSGGDTNLESLAGVKLTGTNLDASRIVLRKLGGETLTMTPNADNTELVWAPSAVTFYPDDKFEIKVDDVRRFYIKLESDQPIINP